MSTDLADELRRLAEAAPVDSRRADELGLRAHGMVARIRRRRAARRGATAVLSVAAVAVLAVGGLPSTHATDKPPASSGENALGRDRASGPALCGRTLDEAGWATTSPARLAAHPIAPFTSGHAGLGLWFALASTEGHDARGGSRGGGDAAAAAPKVTVTSLDTLDAVAVAGDGRIVGVLDRGAPAITEVAVNEDEGSRLMATGTAAIPLRSCDPADETLPAGEYAVHLRQTGTMHHAVDGSAALVAVSDPIAITLPTLSGTGFPSCGEAFDPDSNSVDGIEARLRSKIPPVIDAGGHVDFDLEVTSTSRSRLLSGQGFAAGLVFEQHGVIVGGGAVPIVGDVISAGRMFELSSGRAAAVDCEGIPLPPGEYTAYPVLDVQVDDVSPSGWVARPVADLRTVVAEPLTLTVR
ncbi:hypothetical protein [Cellulomonas chengniuliangii]|uniref:DUF4179 domain-containing protein n=1 Tax=Cellulomonas chengniuliangii TaxID=2968084 RepID=A0ABY5L2Z8_9CELL|nr:hypothetical protein [Cellulomonas chengniuliangii]MCC2309493.1 hypothetical protein [Cellulomonas chengniuliangii]UUI74948.1 hypothetical protein NP064_14365 [Cellulomonas chengniuliangii]